MNIDQCEKIFARSVQSASESEFYHLIEPLFDEYEILTVELERSSIFWRARVIDADVYPNLSDVDYPPPELTKVGRLNDEGVPFFYVSTDMETALAEVNASRGQFVQLAGFKIKRDFPLVVAVVGEYSNVQKNGYMHFVGADPDRSVLGLLNGMPRQEAIKKIYIDRFFAHILRDPSASANNYCYSRTLAQAIFTKNCSGGIVFPSVKDRGGFNLGVKSDASDQSFENVSCVVVKVNACRQFGLIEYEVLNAAIRLDEDLNFIWPASYIPESLSLYNLTKEEYASRVRDASSKFYYGGGYWAG